jgi:hypothetical protein
MGIYDADWQDKPAGYYADNKIKTGHDRRVTEERRFSRLVENELGKMGYDRHRDIPTDADIERAEEIARRKF